LRQLAIYSHNFLGPFGNASIILHRTRRYAIWNKTKDAGCDEMIMNRVKLIAFTLILSWFCIAISRAQESSGQQAFRLVSIPVREHGYSNFETVVIGSSDELATFISTNSFQKMMEWNQRDKFLEAIKKADIDFRKESLVLIRDTEPSGSTIVSFGAPKLDSSVLICQIQRKVPAFGTADMAYYCFGVVVSKSIEKVRVVTQGRQTIDLKI
jgi:hypothetical protein